VFNGEKPREEALVPCKSRCPAGVDVPRYIRFARQGNYAAAAAVVRERAIFAGILGHICTHFCELECKRRFLNESVNICGVKRFSCANADDSWKKRGFHKAKTGKKVAVIGAGPAGMAAAYYLQKCGHGVTVFEKEAAPGGTTRYGIPEYRLPRAVIEKEAAILTELGVVVHANTAVTDFGALLAGGFHAVLVAIGTGKGVRLPIDGSDAAGVLVNTEFLMAAAKHEPVAIGKRVIVLGGGNVACDCAGMAVTLGAAEVHLACLEGRDAMPASPEELEAVEKAGVIVHPGVTFDRIVAAEGKVGGLECSTVASCTFDENRRPIIEKVADSGHRISGDTVIFAVGQRPDTPPGFEVTLGRGGTIAVDELWATGTPGVFATGDAVTGTSSVVQALAEARKAASSIDRYLGGDGNLSETLAPGQSVNDRLDPIDIAARPRQPCVNEHATRSETERCLQCDLRLRLTPQKFWSDYAPPGAAS
jgi:NADPH-dependent glutamate synthase beta subunit-like oxidoreductase